MPVGEIVYSLALTDDALCYTSGKQAAMYGKGGMQHRQRVMRGRGSWDDASRSATPSLLSCIAPLLSS